MQVTCNGRLYVENATPFGDSDGYIGPEGWTLQVNNYFFIFHHGTDNNNEDIQTDFKFTKYTNQDGIKVHRGFNEYEIKAFELIKDRLPNKDKRIIVIGHSLGGGIAQIMSYRLFNLGYQVTYIGLGAATCALSFNAANKVKSSILCFQYRTSLDLVSRLHWISWAWGMKSVEGFKPTEYEPKTKFISAIIESHQPFAYTDTLDFIVNYPFVFK
jgi:pimeloyl-ACP methyl ester carboxylesterase